MLVLWLQVVGCCWCWFGCYLGVCGVGCCLLLFRAVGCCSFGDFGLVVWLGGCVVFCFVDTLSTWIWLDLCCVLFVVLSGCFVVCGWLNVFGMVWCLGLFVVFYDFCVFYFLVGSISECCCVSLVWMFRLGCGFKIFCFCFVFVSVVMI